MKAKAVCVVCGKACHPWEQNTDGSFTHAHCVRPENIQKLPSTKEAPVPKKTLPHALPVTASMKARPVWARRERRLSGELDPLEPPTEEEKQDAIRVLEANLTIPWSLYEEAERILHDAI